MFRRAACFQIPQKIRLPACSAKKIPDVGCGGTDEGKRPEFSGKSMRDACDGSLKCGGNVNLVNDVLSCWIPLLLTTEQDAFARAKKCRYAQSAHSPTFSAISPAYQPAAMKKNVWQQHKIMVGQTRDPE